MQPEGEKSISIWQGRRNTSMVPFYISLTVLSHPLILCPSLELVLDSTRKVKAQSDPMSP